MASTSSSISSSASATSASAIAAVVTTAVFFAIAVLSLSVYGFMRLQQRNVSREEAKIWQPYVLEQGSTVAVDATREKSLKANGDEGTQSTSSNKALSATLRRSTDESPTSTDKALHSSSGLRPSKSEEAACSGLRKELPLPRIPPTIPTYASQNSGHFQTARYTMPPPTPIDPMTGLHLDLTLRTPPPVYDKSMERAQLHFIRHKRSFKLAMSQSKAKSRLLANHSTSM